MKREKAGFASVAHMAGWFAAAGALTWAVAARTGTVSADEGEGEAERQAAKIAEFAPDLSAKAESPDAAPAKAKEKAARPDPDKWRPQDKWNVPALYELLGNVPPQTRRIADRIYDAHRRRDFNATLACVDDALACDNPIVRAMMADALRLFAFIGSQKKGEGAKEANKAVKRTVAKTVKRMFQDPCEYVRQQAVNTWLRANMEKDGWSDVMDADVLLREVEQPDHALAKYVAESRMDVTEHFMIDRTLSKLDGAAARIAKMIDANQHSVVGDAGKILYRMAANKEYSASVAQDETEISAKGQYSDENTQKAYAALLKEIQSGNTSERAKEIMDDVLRNCSNPWMAMGLAVNLDYLEREAVRRYGSLEDGREWFEIESAQQVSRYRKAARSKGEAKGEWATAQDEPQTEKTTFPFGDVVIEERGGGTTFKGSGSISASFSF